MECRYVLVLEVYSLDSSCEEDNETGIGEETYTGPDMMGGRVKDL